VEGEGMNYYIGRYRSLIRVSNPAVEPVSVRDFKIQCRIDTEDEDDLLVVLLGAAREWAEQYTASTFIHTQWQMKLDGFPAEIRLPRPPMAIANGFTGVSIVYTPSTSGSTTTLSAGEYRIDNFSRPGTLRPNYGQSWPAYLTDENSVTVTWWAGYGADATKVPHAAQIGMMMIAAHLWKYREQSTTDALKEVPMGARNMLDTVRFHEYG
jgi:uncharacterized phiE125 gp8 family phage protein